MEDSKLIQYVLACREEAKSAKQDRMELNEDNYDQYHLKHDFTHKRPGQSREVLSRQRMAVEQTKSSVVQSLIDVGTWWKCEPADETTGENLPIKPHEIYKLTNYKMEQADLYAHVGHAVQAALLGSLWLTKVHGCTKPKPKFVARKKGRGAKLERWVEKSDDKTWHLKYDLIRHENYYPDPTGSDLYEIEESFLDLHVVKALSRGDYALYDLTGITLEQWRMADFDQESGHARETGQNERVPSFRPQVKITELWGTLLDSETGDVIFENCVITIANEKHIIRKPTPNPLWHQRTPIVRAALLEVGNSVWHTALMDAGTKHNRAQTEMFNLMIDAAMQAIHNVNQLRVDALQDPKQISGGIPAGTTLKVTGALPPGAKVIEPCLSGVIPPDVLNMFSIISQEGNSSMLTNEVRSGGGVASSQTRATAVVEASNVINSVFAGITKNIETRAIQPILELSWMTVAQNWDLIDESEFKALFGEERGEQLSQLPAEEVFAATVSGVKFHVFGLTKMLGQQADFRKWTTLLQTLGASEVLIQAFLDKYGDAFGQLVEEIIRSLGIDPSKLMPNPAETPKPQAQPMQPAMEQPGMAPGAGPQMMSQVPQAAAGGLAAILGAPQSTVQKQNFPGSRALSNQGGNS